MTRLPGFTAQVTLGASSRVVWPPRVRGWGKHPTGVVPAAMRASIGQFQRLGYSCGGPVCVCRGDADCNDMFTWENCGSGSICIDDACLCVRYVMARG
jgi:hypothetical protein